MFKKLKEKITEEVKSSPQRFQQLTQSVSDKLQGANSTDDNFFSIADDDANVSNTSTADQGYSSVALVSPSSDDKRRTSISSLASDISFLPKYEGATLYHLQSDLDVSASELEDNLSQSSSSVGRVSKEQLYSAFKKSQMQYHKYRGRYTDLARHYKEMEREIGKMKSTLVDNQDRAIRRVTELKEQCALEQKAKAHLESALRDELDEKQMKIQSLETKINLLQGHNGTEMLIEQDKNDIKANQVDFEKLDQLTKYLNDARSEIESLNTKIQEYKAGTIVLQSKEQEYKTKILNLEKDISGFSEREKENNIKLAENKMELHNELLSKDSDISRLKKELENLKSNLNFQEKEGKNTRIENLQTQNNKLIEKVENLTHKCNGFENELLKMEKYKMDIAELTQQNSILKQNMEKADTLKGDIVKLTTENNELQNTISTLRNGLSTLQDDVQSLTKEKHKLVECIEIENKEYEEQIENLRDSAKKGLFSLEKQILEKTKIVYEEKEQHLRNEFAKKIEEISQNNQGVKQMHLELIEKDNAAKAANEELNTLREHLLQKEKNIKELQSNQVEVIYENEELRRTVGKLEKYVNELQSKNSLLTTEIELIQETYKEKEENNVELAKEILKLETINAELNEKVRLDEEKQESIEMDPTECDLLKMKVQALEEEKMSLLDNFEQERKILNEMIEENKDLKVRDIQIGELENINHKLQEKILRMKGFLKNKEAEIVDLHKSKLHLEQELTKLKEEIRILEEQEEAIEIDKTECNLLQIKVQQLENEKENLIKSFEQERDVYSQSLHEKITEFDLHKQEIMEENVSLAKENLQFKTQHDELLQTVRIFEERDQVIELEETECNLLKAKLTELEKENLELVQGFEMEREMFNKMLIEHKDLKLKEEHIKSLEESNRHLTEKLADFKKYLKEKKLEVVELEKAKLILEGQISAITEEKLECSLLQLKIQVLEEDKENLLNSFELERKTFEDALSNITILEDKVEVLTNENIQLKDKMKQVDADCKLKIDKNIIDLDKKSSTISEQIQMINSLNRAIDELKYDYESVKIENKRNLDRLEILEQELADKKTEIEEVKAAFDLLKGKSEKINIELDKNIKKVESIQNEKVKLETELNKRNQEYNFKIKEMEIVEQQFSLLRQEKENLIAENKNMKVEVDQLLLESANLNCIIPKVKELEQLTKQHEALQKEYDQLNQEISQLKVRINQLTSQNSNINVEYEKLSAENEQYKAKNEILESSKVDFDRKQEQNNEENNVLRESVERLTEELTKLKKDYQILHETTLPKETNSDFENIQKDFYELKEKCDNLFLENKNLKQEYTKLEEQCDNFNLTKRDLENQLAKLEGHYNEVIHEKQLLQDEIQELKISPINVNNGAMNKLENLSVMKQEQLLNTTPNGPSSDLEQLQKEIVHLSDTLTQYKSLDVTNKSSLEFYENELQKVKNKNEKLNRKLDETLVTLNHCTELSSSTEIEYLRNVLYNYMLGKESLVLARVIAAVCKFDPNQTEAVLQKEQQKQTLLGQLGLL